MTDDQAYGDAMRQLAHRLEETNRDLMLALERISDHPVISGRGPDEDCDWHCTAELVAIARGALGTEEQA